MREARVRRILSALLLLYPHSFRCMLGEDLLETTIRRWRDSTLAFWWIELPRFVLDGVLERLRTAPSFVAERTDRRAPMTVLLAATPLADLAIGVKMLRSPREMPAMVVALSIGVGLTVAAYSLIQHSSVSGRRCRARGPLVAGRDR